jgi:two-component sensor histidine kinase
VFLLLSAATYAQSISPEEAKTLSRALTNGKADTAQINILLKLAKYQVFKPGENKTDLDSAANFIKQAESLNATIKSKWTEGYIFLIQSYMLREGGQRDKGREAAGRAVAILKNEADKNLAGEAYMEMAGYYDYNNSDEMIQRTELVRAAINYFEQGGNIQQKAAALQMLGDLYNIDGKSYLALQQLQASLDAYNSIRYSQVQGIYCLMGFIYSRLREYNKALEKEFLALKTAESVGDSSMQLCEIYNYLGEIHLALTDREKAIYYYEKAREIATNHNDTSTIYLTTANIANCWVALNKPYKALEVMKVIRSTNEQPNNSSIHYQISRCYIGAYSALRQFDKARPYVNQLLQLADELQNESTMIGIYTVAIRFYISDGEIDEANKYLDKHNEIATRLKNFYYLASNQKLRFMMDTTQHNYKAATAHLLEYNRLNDSSSLQAKNSQIAQLQVQFETEKKEKDILVKDQNIQLLTKQSELQQSTIKQDRFTRNATIVGAGLLLLVLIMVYSRYVLKQKSNRQLQQQQQQIKEQNLSLQSLVREQNKLIGEKEWLIKEIHHRVKNNLQIVMSLLNSQSAYIDNESALTAIHDSQHRVHAMSLIHQKLYNAENVSSIDMSFYIRELVSYLSDSFNTGQRLRFEFDIEPLEMDVSQAVPLGLILNETITNAIKYAFPDGRNGVITVSLSQTAPHHYLLTISDNGIGIPLHVNNKKPGSLGMSLIAGLSEDLDGNFSIENNNGTIIKISFVMTRVLNGRVL